MFFFEDHLLSANFLSFISFGDSEVPNPSQKAHFEGKFLFQHGNGKIKERVFSVFDMKLCIFSVHIYYYK